MADPLSITAGAIAIITATIQSTTALHTSIQSFRAYPRRVAGLKDQLKALIDVLQSLKQLTEEDPAPCKLLEAPLRQCSTACDDFKRLLASCKKNAKDGRLKLSEWARLTYRSGDIADFTEALAVCKSTIGIAIADANL